MKYRIRWANVQLANGRSFTTKRMCIAERKTWLGWWPVRDADWTFDEDRAAADIENDKWLRSPPPPTEYFN